MRGQWQRRVSWMKQRIGRWQLAAAGADSQQVSQYYLGRGRRAREAGRPESGVIHARRAITLAPRNPWAYALLGQCLLHTARRDPRRQFHLPEAAHALERARRLDPTNGYFVRLALDIAYEQNDAPASRAILHQAWWTGAPVERWLPAGPPKPQASPEPAASVLHPVDQPAPITQRLTISPPLTAHPVLA